MIKQYIAIAIIVFTTLGTIAQDYNGKIMVNLTIDGSSLKRLDKDDVNYDVFSNNYFIKLKSGYFISDKKLVGISLGYNWSGGNDQFPDDTVEAIRKEKSYEIGPFFKEYFKLIKNLYFTLDVSPYYKYSSLKNSFPEGDYEAYHSYKEHDIYISVSPGFSFDVNEKLSLEFEMGFFNAYLQFRKLWDSPVDAEMHRQFAYGTSTSLNEFDMSDIFLGFTYRFNRK